MQPVEFRAPELIAHELVRVLEDEIIFEGVAAGSRLVEEDVVRRYDVSRSPVREAFRILEQEGLVVRELRRGVRVSAISVADLDEVYACRLPLEALAAELTAQNRTLEGLKTIESELDGLRAAYDAGDMRGFFRQNVKLSECIYLSAGSATLKRLLGNIGKQALRYRFIAYRDAPDLMRVSIEANSEILAAIARQRPRHARMLTEDVIQRSWTRVREIITKSSLADAASIDRVAG